MTSKTSICNKAVRKLGAASIINIDTDSSKPATECKAVYDDVLLEVLRAHSWNFATFRQELNKDTTTPAYGFTYRYILPTVPSPVRIIEVYQNPEFEIENGYLLSNEDSIKIRFIGKETNSNKYDSIFIDVFATRLASEICYRITGDNALAASLDQRYLVQLSQAVDKDIQESSYDATTGSTYNDARLSYFSNDISTLVK